jgi:hypothetical protein
MNFYEELQKIKNEISDNQVSEIGENDLCLINKDILTTNYIILPCKHKFNYLPLYKTICIQKQKQSSNSLETSYLGQSEIRCPYCRTKFDKLLPYIPMKGVGATLYVNYPITCTMAFQCCNWLKKTGINKGQMCNKPAYFDVDDIKVGVPYCISHWKEHEKQAKVKLEKLLLQQAKQDQTKQDQAKQDQAKQDQQDQEWTKEMNDYSKKKSVGELRDILRKSLKKVGGTKKELIHRIFENKLVK